MGYNKRWEQSRSKPVLLRVYDSDYETWTNNKTHEYFLEFSEGNLEGALSDLKIIFGPWAHRCTR